MSTSLAKNTIQYLPAQFLGPFVLFTSTVIWTHFLDPVNFGVLAFVVAAQELTGLFGLTWWSIFVVRFQSRFEEENSGRFLAMDVFVMLLAIVVQIVCAAPVLIWIGVAPRLEILGSTIVFLATRTLLNHLAEWSRARHRIGAYTAAQVGAPAVGCLVSFVALAAFRADATTVLAAMAAGQAAGVAAVMYGLRRMSWNWRFDPDLFAQARRYGAPLVASGILIWSAVNGVRILVQWNDGVAAVGLFSVGWSIGQRLAAVLAMLCTAAAFPIAVRRLEAGDRAGALRQVANNGVLMIGLLAPAVAGVAILARPFVTFLIAPDFREVTIVILPIAVATAAARIIRIHIVDQAGLLLERTGTMTSVNLIDVTLTLVGAAAGVLFGGIVGAAIGCLAGALASCCGALAFATLKMDMPIPAMALLKVGLATAVMTTALLCMPSVMNSLQMGFHIVAGVLVYLIAIIAIFTEIRRVFVIMASALWRREAAIAAARNSSN